MLKRFVQFNVARKAKELVRRYDPIVVAVTGSVGKTSTRNAIAKALEERFRVRRNAGNLNNEFGTPLTIIGETSSPGRSIPGWLKVSWHADKQILFKKNPDFPNLLVLEYGADRPGDIAHLCQIAQPDIAVITAISPVHAENFTDIEALAAEKATLGHSVKEDGVVILNADDPRVFAMKDQFKAKTITYGFSDQADVRAEDFRMETREDYSFDPNETFSELHFNAVLPGQEFPVTFQNMLGRGQVSSALAAIAVGSYLDVPLGQIVDHLKILKPEPGRMRPLPGIKGSLILDDSYNAAPASVMAALETLERFSPVEDARRIAALGQMAELGQYSEEEHRKMGERAAQAKVDLLIGVGEPAQDILRGAIDAGLSKDQTMYFTDSESAGRWLDREVRKGDIVLVKGSQSARMEKITKDLMAEPLRAKELLVRQYGKWLEE